MAYGVSPGAIFPSKPKPTNQWYLPSYAHTGPYPSTASSSRIGFIASSDVSMSSSCRQALVDKVAKLGVVNSRELRLLGLDYTQIPAHALITALLVIAFPVFSATKTSRPFLPQSAWFQKTKTSALASPFTARRNDVISFSGLSLPRFQVAPGNAFLYDSAREGVICRYFPHLLILIGFATTSGPRRLAPYAGTHL